MNLFPIEWSTDTLKFFLEVYMNHPITHIYTDSLLFFYASILLMMNNNKKGNKLFFTHEYTLSFIEPV